MIEPSQLNEFFSLLKNHNVKYWVFGGFALDASRGHLTRPHKDIDVYVYYKDTKKMLRQLMVKGFSCFKKGHKYLIKKKTLNIEIVILSKNKDDFIAYSNRKITYYPIKIFERTYYASLGPVRFRIAPREVLVFKSKYSQDLDDKRYGTSLQHNMHLEKKIWYKPIQTEETLEKIELEKQ